jgi:hypothetical protein
MGSQVNNKVTGQGKLEALRKLGKFEAWPSYNAASAGVQYAIDQSYDFLAAKGELPPEEEPEAPAPSAEEPVVQDPKFSESPSWLGRLFTW